MGEITKNGKIKIGHYKFRVLGTSRTHVSSWEMKKVLKGLHNWKKIPVRNNFLIQAIINGIVLLSFLQNIQENG